MAKNWAILPILAVLGLALIPLQSFAAVDGETAVGVWLFDDGDVSDSSGNGNDGELINGAEVTDGGKWGKALSLDGDDDYANVANSASLDSTAEAYTGVAWIKIQRKGDPHSACCADDHMVIAFTTQWNNILNVFGPGRGGNQGKVEVGSRELNPSWLSGPTAVNDDQWHHLAFTYDGAKKILYVDGEVDAEHDTTGVFGVAGVDVHLGGTPTQRLALGLMDEIAVFNVPLEQTDIQNLMNDGLGSVLGLTPVTPQGRLTTTWADIKSQ